MKRYQFGTLIGCIAVIIWSFSIVLLIQLNEVPVTELVTILYFFSALPSVFSLSISNRWKEVHTDKKRWGIGVALLTFFQVFVTLGVRMLNPAATELIVQMWPILAVLLIGLLPQEKFSMRYLAPVILAFFGVWALFWGKSSLGGALWALLFPALACLSWCGYVLFSRYYREDPPEMVGLYLGVGGLIALVCHIVMIREFSISIYQLGILAILGVGVLGVAQLMWDFGTKNGDVRLMSIFANVNPALALTWLIVFGYAKPSLKLFISYGLIISASLFAYRLSSQRKAARDH